MDPTGWWFVNKGAESQGWVPATFLEPTEGANDLFFCMRRVHNLIIGTACVFDVRFGSCFILLFVCVQDRVSWVCHLPV